MPACFSAEDLNKIKNIKDLESKAFRFNDTMEGELRTRLQVYEANDKEWKTGNHHLIKNLRSKGYIRWQGKNLLIKLLGAIKEK